MEAAEKKLIPGWVWAVLAVATVGMVLALFATERRRELGDAFKYDVSSYAKVDAAAVRFKEAARFPISVNDPSAMTVDAKGRILVGGENAIEVLDGDGKETARYGLTGAATCLAVGGDGRIYVGMRRQVQVLDAEGALAGAWQDLGENAWLTSLAVDDQYVFAADAGNRVVLRFDLKGNLLGKIGARNDAQGVGGFVVPSPYFDVLLDATGTLWAVNPGRHGFENYRPDGELVSSWYRPGMGLPDFCGCCNPIHAAFRSDGSVATVEKGISRIKVYGPDNAMVGVVATPETLGAPNDPNMSCELESPVKDLAVDAKNRILVLHGPWKSVLVYQEESANGQR